MTTQTSAQTGDQSVSDRANDVKDRAADVGGTVQDKAAEVTGTAQERAADVAGTAKDQALEVAQEAQRQARDLIGEFRGQIQQQTQTQRDRLVELLREFEDELQNMVQAGGRNGTASELVRQVADRLSGVRSYLEGGANPLDDVRSFARRRPGAFLLLAGTAGVLAGRATRGAAAARKAEQASGRHVIDVREGVTPTSYGTTSYTSPSTGYTSGTGYTGGTTGTDYGTGGYGTSTSGYAAGGGTAYGDPLTGVERTSDPNLAPTSGPLTGATDADLGMPDAPAAPEYGGEGVGMPGPNAPTGSDVDYGSEHGRHTGNGYSEGER
jgi:hypothetical protein